MVKNLPVNAGDASSIPGLGGSLKENMATHSSILALRIPWTEEPGGLQSTGSQRVGPYLVIIYYIDIMYIYIYYIDILYRTALKSQYHSWASHSFLICETVVLRELFDAV